jgi:hypothetical protein
MQEPPPSARAASDLYVQFCQTTDRKRIAYAVLGKGSPLVFPAWWINHLEVLWQHPTGKLASTLTRRLLR